MPKEENMSRGYSGKSLKQSCTGHVLDLKKGSMGLNENEGSLKASTNNTWKHGQVAGQWTRTVIVEERGHGSGDGDGAVG